MAISSFKAFRQQHHTDKILILPNVWDTLTARLIVASGYQSVATASFSVAAANGYEDGEKIPFDDRSFDVVMFVDVLHHTQDPMVLLREAARVSRVSILLKDHNDNGVFSNTTLRMMDWVGNSPHGVALPYNYWKRRAWDAAFAEVGVEPKVKIEKLGLYPALIDKVCGRQLHFIASLSVPAASE